MRNRYKVLLLITSALMMSGCLERGYQVTLQPTTHTATVESVTDLRSKNKTSEERTFKKMQKAVKKALKKSVPVSKQEKTNRKPIIKSHKKQRPVVRKIPTTVRKKRTKTDLRKPHQRPTMETEQKVALPHAPVTTAPKPEKRGSSLFEEINAALTSQTATEETVSKTPVQSPTQKEHPVIKETPAKTIQTVEKVNTQTPIVTKEKVKPTQKPKTAPVIEKKPNISQPISTIEKPPAHYSNIGSNLQFHHINKTYNKFGTSEIHGKVVYLNKLGDEIDMQNIHAYLLPKSATLDHWYRQYYLKNKVPPKTIKLGYINQTTPDLKKSFGFYGVPEGKYYVIIVADDPMKINAKVYIAKMLTVGKYKKIMAVFSKKL